MMWNNKWILTLSALCFSLSLLAQNHYERKITGTSDEWNKIVLPNGAFSKLAENFSDIRIIGVNEQQDTIEAPYLLKVMSEETIEKEIAFELINQSSNGKGFFYTFNVGTEQSINTLKLDFAEENFDWKVNLVGSQDQKEWFTILEDYRIVAINNEQTEFRYSSLKFPKSQYAYLRVQVNAKKQPKLLGVTVRERNIQAGSVRPYQLKNWSVRENEKQTLLDIELKEKVPISSIQIKVKDQIDFYRPLSIQYLRDSIETPKGWKPIFREISKDVLSSVGDQTFDFFPQITNKIRLLIRNYDNEPLDIESIDLAGNTHEIWTRLKPNYQYTLQYGNHKLRSPNYDIARFKDKIPTTLPTLELGKEEWIVKSEEAVTMPLFQNQLWLWAILLIIIAVLGRFTLKMMK